MACDELRLECLRLAQAGANVNARCATEQEVVNRARAYYDFIAGKNDAEIIGAARELSDKMRKD